MGSRTRDVGLIVGRPRVPRVIAAADVHGVGIVGLQRDRVVLDMVALLCGRVAAENQVEIELEKCKLDDRIGNMRTAIPVQ